MLIISIRSASAPPHYRKIPISFLVCESCVCPTVRKPTPVKTLTSKRIIKSLFLATIHTQEPVSFLWEQGDVSPKEVLSLLEV